VTPLDLVVQIGAILDDVGLDWVLGGSLASSLVGEPRATLDIDVAVLLERRNVEALVAAVRADYYVIEPMVLEAVEHGSSFNLLHFGTGFKIDVFVLTDDALDRRQLAGRQTVTLDDGTTIWVGSPIDQVLRKLRWFQSGGEVSDRQWRDVMAILTVQAQRIDHAELLAAADQLGLGPLASRAIAALDETSEG
jgi:hypothetical protein